jgi:CBS domain-containing protein
MLVRGRRGGVVVVEGARPVGIYTERDVLQARGVAGPRERTGRTPLGSVMTRPVVTVRRDATLREAIESMVGGRRHLVVVDSRGELRGLLTTSDIVQFLTDQFPEDAVNLPPRLRQRFERPEGA